MSSRVECPTCNTVHKLSKRQLKKTMETCKKCNGQIEINLQDNVQIQASMDQEDGSTKKQIDCLECGKKKRLLSKNYAGHDVQAHSKHPFPERVKELILPGDSTTDFLCEDCANNRSSECTSHGPLKEEKFNGGLPPICSGCRDENKTMKREAKKIKKDEVKEKLQKNLDAQLPLIKNLVKDRVGPMTKEAIQNDLLIKSAVRGIYIILPGPIRLMCSEERFIKYCLASRNAIFDAKQNMVDSAELESTPLHENNMTDDVISKIEKLSELHKNGLLSEDEFTLKKQDLLGRL